MYNRPYFIPGYFPNAPSMLPSAVNGTMRSSLGRGVVGFNGARMASQGAVKGLGVFSKLGNSFQAIKGINWGNLINNTSKTLNVVNQAIPLFRQVGPMVNNMKSMLRIASIFKDETDNGYSKSRENNYNKTDKSIVSNNTTSNSNHINNDTSYVSNNSNYYDNSPTFFINN